MRCASGRVAKKAPPAKAEESSAPVKSPPPVMETSPVPDPVPMPAIYHHETKSETKANVCGPKRPSTHKDELPCQQDKTEKDKDQVRDIYLKFEYKKGPPALPPSGSSEDETKARDLAIDAVTQARALLANGPYNNRIGLPRTILERAPHPRTEDARADYIWQDGCGMIDQADRPGDPARLYTVSDSGMDNMPGDLVKQLALLAATTIKLQGGVCEKFSSLVMGILSRIAPPGTFAAKVAWSGDHHYVVLRTGTSQWWVADPWPHNAFVLPWKKNYFEPKDTTAHTTMEVLSPVEHAYGVVFDEGGLDHSYQRAIKELKYTKDDAQFDHAWGQASNLKASVLKETVGRHSDAEYDYAQHDDGRLTILVAAADEWG